MTTRDQLTAERLDALLRMIEESGATKAGELPPEGHARGLRRVRELGESGRVAEAHAEGRGPPEDVGRGPPASRESSQGGPDR